MTAVSDRIDSFRQIYEREVVKLMRDRKVPGFVVKITEAGNPIYERAFGFRSWKGSQPANADTLFGVASITKSMTAVAVLQLREKGSLDLEDPISDYLPVDLDKFPDNPIRIRHLLCHNSGIPNLGSYGAQIRNEKLTTFKTNPIPIGNDDDFYFHLNDSKPWIKFPPGEKFYYNNDAYTLLSKLVAEVSGMNYEEYMRENLFNPLQMERTTFSRDVVEADENHASGYSTTYSEDKFEREEKPHLSGPYQSGAGGLNTSVNELTNYLQMQVNHGEFNGKTVLSKEAIEEMWQPHNKQIMADQYLLYGDTPVAYGYGLSIREINGYKVIIHGGASGVSGGQVAFIPELDLTYTHLYNVGWFDSEMMVIALNALLGSNPYDKVPFFKRRDHFKELVGHYQSYRKIYEIEVKVDQGSLVIESDSFSKSTNYLIPINPKTTKPMRFWQYDSLGRLEIVFTKRSDEIFVEIERNIYRKVSSNRDLEPFKDK